VINHGFIINQQEALGMMPEYLKIFKSPQVVLMHLQLESALLSLFLLMKEIIVCIGNIFPIPAA
jgi:hypothetical protein